MKKLILLIVGLALFSALPSNALILSGSVNNGVNTISTNRASVTSITVVSTNAVVFYLYDSDNTNSTPTASTTGVWGTNFVAGSYATRLAYTTNFVSSYVGYLGYTNWYTNQGLYTYSITNLQTTNVMAPLVGGASSANLTATYPVDATFTRGITISSSANGLSYIITYQTGQ